MTKGIIFLGGALVGAAVSYYLTKKYYLQVKDDELANVREYYETYGDLADKYKEYKEKVEEKYEDALKAFKEYAGDETEVMEHPDELYDKNYAPVEYEEEPYIISFEDYESGMSYAEEELIWYEDEGVLERAEYDEAEGVSQVVDDVEATIGKDAFEKIREDGLGLLYVRNPVTMTDYVIRKEVTIYEE